jgi:hypothetical protein
MTPVFMVSYPAIGKAGGDEIRKHNEKDADK